MKELDYNKPICAEDGAEQRKYILLPRIEGKCYTVVSYDWFCTEINDWNSCACWKTKEEAVKFYREWGYTVRNCEIKVV